MLNTKNDLELTPGPTDGASSLSFSPVADYLAATSWDGQVNYFSLYIHIIKMNAAFTLNIKNIIILFSLSLFFRLGYGKLIQMEAQWPKPPFLTMGPV